MRRFSERYAWDASPYIAGSSSASAATTLAGSLIFKDSVYMPLAVNGRLRMCILAVSGRNKRLERRQIRRVQTDGPQMTRCSES